ncbi:T9SS C-terminal target domain-containing protein [Rhodohalobacter sp. SW132]|nr:T9SS C-terminal target domain-containing protein [Rhodohalobacter sp. SW132]
MIYYTTDGSVPTLLSQPYNEPLLLGQRDGDPNVISVIPTNNLASGHHYRENWQSPDGEVFKIHALRAKAFLPNGDSGSVSTASYIIDPDGLDRFSMPVFSIITDPDHLFSENEGIYVPGNTGGNYYERGRDWEREIHLEFFENDGSRVIAQEAGVRIHGGSSRNRPRKSLRFYARSDYGTSWFNHQLLPDKPVMRYKRFLLRNSGNDWSESLFRDAYLQRLIQGNTDVDLQHSRPAILFINGEYWGIHNIRDRYDSRYLQANYGLDNDRVIIMENDSEFDDGNEDGIESYHELYNYVTDNSMSVDANFEHASLLMDMENFIDYQILQIYVRNTDWPGNNVRFWRYLDGTPDNNQSPAEDGRWRWMIFDLDFGFGLDFDYVEDRGALYGGNDPQHNTLDFALESSRLAWPNPGWSTALFRNLMENDEFKNKFITRFTDLLNSSLKSERAESLLNTMKSTYLVEIDEHISRWREPTRDHWENDIETMRNFAKERENAVRSILDDKFSLGESNQITLSVNHPGMGTVKVNSLRIEHDLHGTTDELFPWSGSYFSNQLIRLIAIPEAGYSFYGWQGDLSSAADTVEIILSSAMELTAHFTEGEPFDGDEMNPSPYRITNQAYIFDHWSEDEPEGSFPPHMVFQQSSVDDPGLDEEMTAPYFIPFADENDNDYHADDQDKFGFPYKLTGRTRINGLGNDGISMINTGRGRDLGAIVLALDTREIENSSSIIHQIEWEAQTLEANSRVYHVRPQYRIGLSGEWTNFYENGEPVEYERNENTSETSYFQHNFPNEITGQPYVQVRWKYYYTGTRLSEESGQRDKIRLNNISTMAYGLSTERSENPGGFELKQNYPNPFNPGTTIEFTTHQTMDVRLEVFDALGRQIAVLVDQRLKEGIHQAYFNASGLSSGLYLYRLESNGGQHVRRMTLIK